MNLFLDDAPDFSKEAAYAARLSEQPENWPQELNSEIFKQLPFLSDYDVNIHLDRQDPDRGAAFGYADVSNKTERPEAEHEQMGIPHIRIPIVVMDRSVKPFSVFLDGERVMPLTEDRIREFLFNPAAFDLSTAMPRDPSLVEPLMPPQRSGIGMGGEYKMASVDTKNMGPEERFVYEGMLEKNALSAKTMASAAMKRGVTSKYLKNLVAETGQARRATGHANLGSTAIKHSISPTSTASQKAMGDYYTQSRMQSAMAKTPRPAPAAPPAAAPAPAAVAPPQSSLKVPPGIAKMRERSAAGIGKAASAESHFLKEAFKHMSKEQWEALYENPNVMKEIEKAGGDRNTRDVQNALYEAAAKVYGFHPKVASAQIFDSNMRAKMTAHAKRKSGVEKTSGISLLLKIAPTIREQDAQRFIEKLSSDSASIAGFQRSGISPLIVEAIDNTKRASADDSLSALADSIQPNVVTVQKLPGGDFLVKSANTAAFAQGPAAQGQIVPAEEAAGALGPETAQAMQPGQTATAVSDPTVSDDPTEQMNRARVVEEFGQYKVQDMHGNSLLGHVFPHTIPWDGSFSPKPLALFTNGSAYSFQDTVAGEMVGKGTNLPKDAPRGDGVFYFVKNGEGFATAPITIGSTMTGPDGLPRFVGTDAFGNQIQVSKMEGLKQPMRVSDNEFALPEWWEFMRLNNQTQLIPDPLQMNKSAAVREEMGSATLFYNGSYHLKGGCGLDKLSSDYRYDMDPVTAEFMLGVLGVEGGLAKVKVAECRKKGSVKLAGLRTIHLLGERYAQAEKTASAMLAKIPNLQVDLIKEAANIDDADTVDKMLALNFINPENLTTFINYIPELEQCSEKLAEMLLYSYIGMKEVPEEPVDRAMKNVEETIKALKNIANSEG